MSHYFRVDGSINYRKLTLATTTMTAFYYFSFIGQIAQVRDQGMHPTFQTVTDTDRGATESF